MKSFKPNSIEEAASQILFKETEHLNEESTLTKTIPFKEIEKALATLDKYLHENSTFAKSVAKELGTGYTADFKKMYKSLQDIYDVWEETIMDLQR